MRLNTKEKREESRKYQFEYLTKNGYLMTEYKNLVIFHHPTELLLKTFWGNSAKHTDFYKYRSAEQMQSKINELKNTADRRETWKAEQKEKKSLAGAKITLSTLKKFVRENAGNIYVKVLSSFDGMTDCVERVEDDFKLITIKEDNGNNLGLPGIHLVGSSRDSFTAYNSDEFEGIEIYNCCGSCIVARKKETIQQAQMPAEVPAGKIQIVDYSEKAFAVIGETKPIKEGLKNLGGKFNFRLTCGAGWIFSKTKLEAVKAFLIAHKGQEQTEQTQQPETPQEETQPEAVTINESDILPTPENNTLKLESLKIIWHEGKHIEGATFEDTTFNTWEEVQRAFFILWQVNEKGSEGGYTKVKCEIKIQGHETEICRVDITDKVNNGDFNPSTQHIVDYLKELIGETDPDPLTTIKDEVKKTIEFFAETDIKMCGQITESTKEAAKVQNVDLSGLIDEAPQHYKNLQDMEVAAKSGKVISLLNMCELVNAK